MLRSLSPHRSPADRPRMWQAGFTLVELLVVIGIIALLISILLPSLGRARAMAKSVKCQGSLHALGQAFMMYAQANRNTICFEIAPKGTPSATNPYQEWFGTCVGALYTPNNDVDYKGALIYPYLRTDLVKFLDCPDMASIDASTDPTGYRFTGTTQGVSYGPSGELMSAYGFNYNTFAYKACQIPSGVRMNWIHQPTDTVLLADTGWMSTTAGKLARYNHMDEPIYGNGVSSPQYSMNFHGRHLKKGNVLWFDGHVTSEAVNYPPTATGLLQYKSLNLGMLTPTADTTKLDSNYYFWLDKAAHSLNTAPVW